MTDRTANPLSFGLCSRCSKEVTGHAVYISGVLLCNWCELDMVLTLNGYKDLDKVK
jgi:hypothetical protein